MHVIYTVVFWHSLKEFFFDPVTFYYKKKLEKQKQCLFSSFYHYKKQHIFYQSYKLSYFGKKSKKILKK